MRADPQNIGSGDVCLIFTDLAKLLESSSDHTCVMHFQNLCARGVSKSSFSLYKLSNSISCGFHSGQRI